MRVQHRHQTLQMIKMLLDLKNDLHVGELRCLDVNARLVAQWGGSTLLESTFG